MRKSSTSGRLVFACAVTLWSTAAAAQPSVLGSSGEWSQKATVTINGAGFGTKSTPAPVVWDDASGPGIAATWDGAWPDCGGNDAYNLAYRTPSEVGRNIPLPHNHITRYIAGAHYGAIPGPQCGYAVIMWKTRTITSFPAYSYTSWYQRTDDGWHFGDDDNYKTFAYSAGVGPYNLPNNWYMEYDPRPTSPTSGATWHLNDDGLGTSTQSLQTPDQNGHNLWWGDAVNPMGGQWSKIEMELKYTNQNDGYVKLWENGVLKVDYHGKTDGLAGSTRTEGIGGYARNYPYTSNWRYFADVYLDYSRARVILGDAPTLDASTIREVQVPTRWSDSSIDVTVNLGRFGDQQAAYLYVVNGNGDVNPVGIPITTASVVAASGETAILGPVTYQGNGRLVVQKATFDVTDASAAYALRVTSVGVKAGLITLNGHVVVRPRDFHDADEVPIRPHRGSNQIVTRFIGGRGSSATIEVVQEPGPPGIPPGPHITLTSPAATAVLTEGATIPITVAAGGEAVRRVDLIVNGVVIASADREAPSFLFTVPTGVNWLNVQARVTDAAGRTASTGDRIVTVVADPMTTVRGYIEDTAGRRIAGADAGVTLHGLSAEIFTFNGTLPSLPSLTGRTPDAVKVISAANLLNPNGVFGIDPFGFGQRSHAIRLTGSLEVTRPGAYTFVLGVTEGGRLMIGGLTIVNVARGAGVFQQANATVWLPAGAIPIEVSTFDNGNPQIQLSYAPPGQALTVIPQSVLTPAFTLYRARSATLGVFSIAGVPTALGDLEVFAASTPARGRSLTGDAGPVAPVAAGVTDVGAVRVH